MMYFTWTITVAGADRTITWLDGRLTGDELLVALFLEGANDPPTLIDPIPYSPIGDWRADHYVAKAILRRIGPPLHWRTNIPEPRWVEGRVY